MSGDPPTLLQRVQWTRGFRCQTDKDVLTAMVRWFCFRPDGTNVRPALSTLAERSRVPRRSVQRALERLEDGLWITVTKRRHRLPTTYQINPDRLAREDPDRMQLVTPVDARVALKNELERHSGAQNLEWRSRNGPEFEKVAHDPDQEQEICTPASTEILARQSGAHPSAIVAAFLTWWTTNFPLHNRGAIGLLHRDDGVRIQRTLDQGFTVDRLQAMALWMWQAISDGDVGSSRWFIAEKVTERNIRVLCHKASFLDQMIADAQEPQQLTFGPWDRLTERELKEAAQVRDRVYNGCPHEPRCESYRVCVENIALARKAAGR